MVRRTPGNRRDFLAGTAATLLVGAHAGEGAAGSVGNSPIGATAQQESKGKQGMQAGNPLVVFVTGDHEYSGEVTLPVLARELEQRYALRTRVLCAHPDQNAEENIPGLEALADADLAVFYLRWRRLPDDQLAHIERYLKAGRPVVGFRTTSHAFNFPAGHPQARWNAFGEFAFGAPPGWGNGHTHYGHEASTDVCIAVGAEQHPILTGVAREFHVRSWLYHVLPKYPLPGATRLLMGRAVSPNKPAEDNPVAWTHRTAEGGRAFFTTLGHPEDFGVEAFQRLVVNGFHWALGREVPQAWAGRMTIGVPYRGMVKTS